MADLAGVFRRPFPQQIAAFRVRLAELRGTAVWTDLWQAEHDRAFMVAGAMKADLLADLAEAVQKAIEQGTGIEAFRRDFRAIVEQRGWHGWTGEGTKRGEAWRTKVIYKTNMQTSYAAGRWAQLMAAGYPLLIYFHGGSVEPRFEHLSWDGLILPADHPFWMTHAPPNGWGCSCYLSGARSERDAVRLGGKPGKTLPDGWDALNPKTGAPAGIDRGWAYAPGASVSEHVALMTAKLQSLPARLGAEFGEGQADTVDAAWRAWVMRALAGDRVDDQLVGTLSPEIVARLAKDGKGPATAEIMVRAGLLSGPKAKRHLAAGDALTADQWSDLASDLRNPAAVLHDQKSDALIYILSAGDKTPQVAIRLDYRRDRRAQGLSFNAVVSAYIANLADIKGRVRGGLLSILMGMLG